MEQSRPVTQKRVMVAMTSPFGLLLLAAACSAAVTVLVQLALRG